MFKGEVSPLVDLWFKTEMPCTSDFSVTCTQNADFNSEDFTWEAGSQWKREAFCMSGILYLGSIFIILETIYMNT